MTPLSVPLLTQQPGSKDCGSICVDMILQYYKYHNISARDDLYTPDMIGTYGPQLAIYMMKHGLTTDIITRNPFLFTSKHTKLTQEQLLEYIYTKTQENKRQEYQAAYEHFTAYMGKGGHISVSIPTADDIHTEIQADRPLIALLTTKCLHDTDAGFNFHFNVITGIDDTHIYVNDPLPSERGGKQKYLIHEYMYALYASAYGDPDNACLIKIKPKEN